MAKNAKESKRKPRPDGNGECDSDSSQLSLSFDAASPSPSPREAAIPLTEEIDRLEGFDRMMKTSEVTRLFRRHRTTIFRWIKNKRFPARHASGDFLRSEIMKYMSDKSGGSSDEPRET